MNVRTSLNRRQARYHGSARSMTERAPWLFEASDHHVVCKDSGVLLNFEYQGPNPFGATQADFDRVAERAQQAFLQMADRPVTMWFTVRRRRVRHYPTMPMPDTVSQRIDDLRRAWFRQGRAYTNRYYFSALLLPERGSAAFFERFHHFSTVEAMEAPRALWFAARALFSARDAFAYSASELDAQLNGADKLAADFVASLPEMRFRRLEGPERLAFLQNAYPRNSETERVVSPADGWMLDAYLPDQHFYPGADFGIFEGATPHHVAALAIKPRGYPGGAEGGTTSNLLSRLLGIDGELTISQCFRVASREEQLAHVKEMRRYNEMTKLSPKQWARIAMRATQEHADDVASKNAAKEAMTQETYDTEADITRGQLFYGWHNLTVLAHGETRQEMEQVYTDADRAVRSAHMVPMRETLHLDSAIGGTVPGQWADVVHWHFLSTGNLADLVPWHTEDVGERVVQYLTEQLGEPCYPLMVARTRAKTLYYLTTYYGDLPHMFVAGPSRTGKTLQCNFLWTKFRQYPRANVIILDRDFSCRIPTLLQGGQHVAVALDRESRHAGGISFAPVAAFLADPSRHEWLADWIGVLIEMNGYRMNSDDLGAVWSALQETAALTNRALWTLSTIRTHLPPHLKIHLDAWVADGQYAHVFDNDTDAFSLGKLTCIEMADILKNRRVAVPFLLYIVMRVDARLSFTSGSAKREPTLIYVEECSFLLQEPAVERVLRGWAATLGKRLTTLMLTTQSVEDYERSTIFPAIRDNFPTRMFLPNHNARDNVGLRAIYSEQFQLNDAQIDALGWATPKQDYLIVKPDGAVMLELRHDEVTRAYLRSDRLAHTVFDRHYNGGHPQPGWQEAYVQDLIEAERESMARAAAQTTHGEA